MSHIPDKIQVDIFVNLSDGIVQIFDMHDAATSTAYWQIAKLIQVSAIAQFDSAIDQGLLKLKPANPA